jgi:hypothetical protein
MVVIPRLQRRQQPISPIPDPKRFCAKNPSSPRLGTKYPSSPSLGTCNNLSNRTLHGPEADVLAIKPLQEQAIAEEEEEEEEEQGPGPRADYPRSTKTLIHSAGHRNS